MAISSGVISLFTQLKAEGFFNGVESVIEFGAQEIKCLHYAPTMKKCLEKFGVLEQLDEKKVGRICSGPSRDFFEAVGFRYDCIDTSKDEGAIFFDLNFDQVEPPYLGAYDLLTNFGTAEHVFNQFNTFKAAHDLVRQGGCFIHEMPFLGYIDHGYYSFQPCFYKDLAAANNYEIQGMWIHPDARDHYYLIPWDEKVLNHLNLKAINYSGLLVIMRKCGNDDFRVPFQGRYESSYSGEFFSRYVSIAGKGPMGIASHQGFMDGLSGYELQRELFKRYIKKFRKMLFGWLR